MYLLLMVVKRSRVLFVDCRIYGVCVNTDVRNQVNMFVFCLNFLLSPSQKSCSFFFLYVSMIGKVKFLDRHVFGMEIRKFIREKYGPYKYNDCFFVTFYSPFFHHDINNYDSKTCQSNTCIQTTFNSGVMLSCWEIVSSLQCDAMKRTDKANYASFPLLMCARSLHFRRYGVCHFLQIFKRYG